MKKRVMLMLCAVGMAFSLSACQGKEEVNNTDIQNEDAGQKEVIEKVDDSSEESSNGDEMITVAGEEYVLADFFEHYYNDLYSRFCMNLPGFNGARAGDSVIYAKGMRIYIAEYSGDVENAFSDWDKDNIDISTYEDSTDIFEILFPDVCNREFNSDDDVEYTVEVVSTEQINGVEMTKFQGEVVYSITDTSDETYPFVAYGIKGAKTPVLVFAYDTAQDGVSLYEDLVKIVDYMVTTYKDL